ncbi:maltase A3-like [Teleopsis dalmanni]|uniref:maltase A3-like n=1 Tax=Teleopsis dalmanni TaxID=139649 RepID=UPI0018CF4A71|nr:maltase A3-like [Teleopsis dalmanni]
MDPETQSNPLFGTMDDFEDMMSRAKELDLRIILDFVPNHSSDECEWFIKSAARDPEYEDFYVWHPGFEYNGVRYPPNNWVSVFRGSAWEWHEGRQEYYFHQYHKKQPDLNYRNPAVKEAMQDVLLFWLDKGVDGFRIDAIHHAFEVAPDANGNYPDEPRNWWNNDPEDYGYTDHVYTADQPETHQLVYEWRSLLEEYQAQNGGDERILMTEAWSDIDTVMKYYGDGTKDGSQIPFNFQMISNLWWDSDAYHYSEMINSWLDRLPEGKAANWVIGNHDKNRVGSRFGSDRMDMFNMLLLTLPGCSITYNGEEIGMTDVWISWKDTVDPQACNSFEDGYEYRSRDPARTPFQWSNEHNAGFSDSSSTWLPVGDNYQTVNVETERDEPLSHLNIYKQLQELRNEDTFKNGEGEVLPLNRYVLGVHRYLHGDYTYVTLLNIFDSIENFDLSNHFDNMPSSFEYVVINDKSIRAIGDVVSSKSITLMPKESVVLKSTTRQ